MKKYYCLLISIQLLCFEAELRAQSIIRGPYLQSGTPNSMVVKWRTDSPTSSQVWYGTSPGNLPFTQTINGSYTDHEVLVSGLSANTTFYYAVGNTSGQLTTPSDNHYFRTSPVPGSIQTIKTWVLGDAGKAGQNQRDVRDAFYNFQGDQHIDVILLLGDNAYESGTDEEYQAAMFENMYEERLINSVVWPTFGNHDGESAFSPTQTGPYYEIFTAPTNGEAGGVPSGTEAYYSFDYGNIHFIVLNSDDSGVEPGSPQLVWLEADLAATDQEWKVVSFHHPPYTQLASDTDNKETAMREQVLPILEAYNVDLVLAGHAHDWQRSYLINGHYGTSNTWNPNTMGINLGDGRVDGDGAYFKNAGDGPSSVGTVYIVSGSAGSRGPIEDYHPIMYKSLGEKGSMYMEVTGSQMDIKFIRETGAIDDYLTIVKQTAVGEVPAVSLTTPTHGSNFGTPQPIALTAEASDSDGAITQVDFLVNGISIGVDSEAPYTVNYTLPNNGAYSALAIATDNDGNTVQSSGVDFTVGPALVCTRIDSGSDDAEQDADGGVSLTSSDLELVDDGGETGRTIGLRFNNLNIPQGTTITNAYLQFQADENTNENPCNLNIYGQASDDATTFSTQDNNVSSRPRTSATVNWTPADWLAVGDAGPAQQTPGLAAILQEIVDRPGFTNSSSVAFLIEGVGRRTAETFEGGAEKAPELCVEYAGGDFVFECPNVPANMGMPCDDGDNTTLNDRIDANCNCTGTPTACTGIGDADGDGVCANVDCDDNDPSITHQPGDACDDGNLATINDMYDGNCNCAGVLNTCPGIGDNDGDGICSDIDCDDNDPNSTTIAGGPCDDGDDTTFNDIYDNNCNCVGTPTACTGIGDADGDGVCADVDCDDNDPNSTSQIGDACNDGDSSTTGETIQPGCGCGGGTIGSGYACVRIATGDDDAEERGFSVDVGSSDLELAEDPSLGAQVIGLRFSGLDIPQGATITSAYLQFTVDENNNTSPCNLTVYGQDTDDAQTFSELDDTDVSGRPKTSAFVNWSPPEWLAVGESGLAQRTPDIAAVIQEIVNRNGYTSGNAIALFIEGTGARTAESFEGGADKAPQLCVAYSTSIAQYDCPAFSANIGGACDDGDNTTLNDTIDANCNCAGTPTACTGIGDADGDGVCADIDCDDNDPTITSTNTGDADCDGVPTAQDCNDNDASVTTNSSEDADCDGVPTAQDCDDNDPSRGSMANDMDCDGVPSTVDCDDNDPSVTSSNVGDADCDGIPTGMDCNDNDPNVTSINTGDGDCDGVPTAQDCDDTDPNVGSNANDADCDGVPAGEDCDDNDPNRGSMADDMDCDGVPSGEDCNDNDPGITSQVGDSCDDGDPNTFGEIIQGDCTCGGGTTTPSTACSTIDSSSDDAEERRSDGRINLTSSDLELGTDAASQWVGMRFNNLNIPQGANIISAHIQFQADETRNDDPCELTIYGQAADHAAAFADLDFDISSRPRTASSVNWAPPHWLAVGDAGPAQQTPDLTALIQEIVDRSGYTSASSIALIIEGTGSRVAEPFDGAGGPQLCIEFFDTPPVYDCPGLSAYFGGPCDDGDNTTVNDTVDGDCNCAGTPTACTGIGDADGDGVCADVDCDDNDPNITTQPGSACDDGNLATINDVMDANCNCAGTLNTCPGIGDNDGDGICADVDCDDNDPNITSQVGDACDDGNPATHGETIQGDCSCGGGSLDPETVCATINSSTDDAEQETASGSMDLNSSDLELCTDRGTVQWVGLRFNNLNIPQGANIVNAYIQFETDETGNDDPCNLTIYGVAADNAGTFTTTDFDISSRPRTANSAAWAPAQWLAVGNAGPAQQTVDISSIIQEIVNRNGYTSASSIAFAIEGTGRRVAESFDGPAGGPQLCIDFFATPPDYDCPNLSAFYGDACDDGDNTTINDIVDGDCGCAGTPTACTGIGDADGDGVCSDVDCDDNDPNATTQPGDACDDGNPATINDTVDANCGCAGALNTCPGIGDNDGDGICADVDCDDDNPNITTQQGDACDDGNPNTVGETIQGDCSCGGGNSAPTQTCAMVSTSSDDAEEELTGSVDATSSDLELMNDPRNGQQVVGLRFTGLNIPPGAVITSAYVQFSVDEAVNDNPCNVSIYGQASDNAATFTETDFDVSSRPRTNASVSWSPPEWLAVGAAGAEQQTPDLSPAIQEIVNQSGYTANSAIALILEGTGRRTAESFNGSLNGAPELCVEYLYATQADSQTPPGIGAGIEQRGEALPIEEVMSAIRVHPNPAGQKLNISFSSKLDGYVQLQARGLSGRIVLNEKRTVSRGENTIVLEELSLPDGIYFLQLFAEGAVQSAKFVISK
ncbi:MAG: metallophosphoesterase [Lewinellaceae bacterium]|nr:metallophosphoesterase [Lewinellaceae bacterium]